MANNERVLRNPLRLLRVFISSRCGDKGRFDAMRERLAETLEAVPLFQAYLWERGGASSLKAKDVYISEINDCDICVVVIDNEDGVPQGVRNEVDHILHTKKRALFFFCNELSEEKTDVQKRLEGADGLTYKVVNRMDEMPDQIYVSLQEEIFLMYRRWCNHDVDQATDSCNPMPVVSAAVLPKAVVSNLPGLREVFGKLIFGGDIERDPEVGLDAAATELAEALYLDMRVEHYKPAKLITVAKSLLPREYAEVVEKRWVGVCRYLSGQTGDALRVLEEALKLARSKMLASWFVSDILIDLRNISSELNDCYWADDKYQEQLTSIDEDVVYPLLDRAVSSAFEEVEKDRIKEGLQGFATVTVGDNAIRFFDSVCKSFAIAACFGSLTHLSLTLQRLRYVVYYLCDKYQDASLNASLLKLSIVCGKRGEAERTIQAFNNMYFDNDSESVKDIVDFCMKYKCMNASAIATFEVFGALGLYLREADFVIAATDFIRCAEAALSSMYRWENKPASIFRAMRSNANRLRLSWMIDYVVRALTTGGFFWQKEALLFLRNAEIDYSIVDTKQRNELLDAFEALVGVGGDKSLQDYVCGAAVVLSACEDQDTLKRLDSIIRRLPDSSQRHYKDVYGLTRNDKGMADLVERGIERIIADNARQGKGGVYFQGVLYHVISAERIKSMIEPSLELGKRLYSACLGTLSSATYDCGGKVSACKAMCKLLQLFGLPVIAQREETEALLANKATHIQCHSLGKETKLLLNVWFDALSLLMGRSDVDDFCISLARCYRADYFTQAGAGDVIACLCQKEGKMSLPDSLYGFLFAYACYLAKSHHFQLNVRGLELLSVFVETGDFRLPAAQALYDGYAGQSPRGKMIIVDSIPLIRDIDAELADELRTRVLRDNATVVVDYLKKTEATVDHYDAKRHFLR